MLGMTMTGVAMVLVFRDIAAAMHVRAWARELQLEFFGLLPKR